MVETRLYLGKLSGAGEGGAPVRHRRRCALPGEMGPAKHTCPLSRHCPRSPAGGTNYKYTSSRLT